MRCLLFTWEAVWGDGMKHDDMWYTRSSGFLNVEAARTGALTSGKPPSDQSLSLEPACTTSKVPFLPAPADDIIFSIKTYRAFDIHTAPSRRHRGSNKEQATSLTPPQPRPQIQTSSRVGWTPEQSASSPAPFRCLSQDTNLCLHFSNNITR